jgi:pimeloyl-ACP methyl ester carboxylesterase
MNYAQLTVLIGVSAVVWAVYLTSRKRGERAQPELEVVPYRPHRVAYGATAMMAYDYGGAGIDVVVLGSPGLGAGDQSGELAEALKTRGMRPVVFDVFGSSTGGPVTWSPTTAGRDISAVVGALQLDRPVVIGRGLGGVVAAMSATPDLGCPLVVVIDGYLEPTGPTQYLDVADPESAHAALKAELACLAADLDPYQVEAFDQVNTVDPSAVYATVQVPLALLLTEPESGPDEVDPFSPEATAARYAYLRWLRWDLAALAAQHPHITVYDLGEALAEEPVAVADVVARLNQGDWS